eukprot:COSAG06_NODE_13882_length_1209_cov_1.809910_1_plen_62_part_10
MAPHSTQPPVRHRTVLPRGYTSRQSQELGNRTSAHALAKGLPYVPGHPFTHCDDARALQPLP